MTSVEDNLNVPERRPTWNMNMGWGWTGGCWSGSECGWRVVLDEEVSEWADVFLRVPQGSVLGLTLFLIFITNIDTAVEVTSSVLFADNTKVGRVVESGEQRVEH